MDSLTNVILKAARLGFAVSFKPEKFGGFEINVISFAVISTDKKVTGVITFDMVEDVNFNALADEINRSVLKLTR